MAISIGDALLHIGVDKKDFDKQMTGIGAAIKKHQKAIGIGMVAVGGAILAAGALSIKTFAEMGDAVQKMALRTGFSTEALSELKHAAEISGSSLESLEKGVKKMSKTIVDASDGLATYVRSFEKIGLTAEELMELSPEEQFNKITMAIAELESPTLRAAVAQEIFGRAGTELLPLMAAGAEGIATLRQEAHDLGIVFDQEAADSAANFNDAMKRMDEAMTGVKMVIAETLIPALMPLIDRIKETISNVTKWMKAHPGLTKVIIIATGVLGGLLVVLGSLLLLLPTLTSAIGILKVAFIGLALPKGPIMLVVLAIGALIVAGIALWKNWDKVTHFFKMAWASMKIAVLTAIEKILGALATFTSWIPILGDKVQEAHDAISNMVDAEKVERDLLRVNRALEINKEILEDTTVAVDDLTEAEIEHREELEKQEEVLLEQKGIYEDRLEQIEDIREALEYERSEAGKLRITTDDVTRALILQGWTNERITTLWEEMGDEVNNVNSYLMATGLIASEVTSILEDQTEAVDGLKKSYAELGVAPVGGVAEGVWPAGVGAPPGMTLPQYEARARAIRDASPGMTATESFRQVRIAGTHMEGLHEGGIAMRPMHVNIAEKKPEAIIPLDKLERMIGGVVRTVNIFWEVDGRVIARAIEVPLVDDIRLRTGIRI